MQRIRLATERATERELEALRPTSPRRIAPRPTATSRRSTGSTRRCTARSASSAAARSPGRSAGAPTGTSIAYAGSACPSRATSARWSPSTAPSWRPSPITTRTPPRRAARPPAHGPVERAAHPGGSTPITSRSPSHGGHRTAVDEYGRAPRALRADGAHPRLRDRGRAPVQGRRASAATATSPPARRRPASAPSTHARADDLLVTGYRCHGFALARGRPPRAVDGRAVRPRDGCAHGRGGSMHLLDVDRGFYGGWGIVGGQLPWPPALALALVRQQRRRRCSASSATAP